MDCRSAQTLVHQYLDDELEPFTAAVIAKHLEACATCHDVYKQQRALRSAIREHAADHFPIPQRLHARIKADLTNASSPATTPEAIPWGWPRVGALLTLTAVVASGLTFFLTVLSRDSPVTEEGRLAEQAISGHLRSLIPEHLTDISSSDPQTVQEWFADRLGFSPLVKDLTGRGFDLVGGRVDYMYKHKVAAIIYRRGEHVINLYLWPAMRVRDSATQVRSDEGFSILLWTRSGINFCSISDLDERELIEFARAYGAGTT